MKTIWFFTIVFGVFSIALCQNWQDVRDRARLHNVVVHGKTMEGLPTFGTGVVVDTAIFTCSHNVMDLEQIYVTKDSTYEAIIYQTVIAPDGVAMLLTEIPALGLKFREMELMEEYLVMGNQPSLLDIPLIVRAVRYIDSMSGMAYPIWLCQGELTQGFSGSGVWNIQGELVGIVWGYVTYGKFSLIGITPIVNVVTKNVLLRQDVIEKIKFLPKA